MDENGIESFLADLAAGTAEPGGGAAAALMAATGAALLAMTCSVSIGRELGAVEEAELVTTRGQAEVLRREAIALITADGEAYRKVMAARRLPRGNAEEKAERATRIEEAMKVATEVPLRIVRVAGRVIESSAKISTKANPQALGDLAVGVLAARSALDGATLTARINVGFIKDPTFQALVFRRLTVEMEAMRAMGAVLLAAKPKQ